MTTDTASATDDAPPADTTITAPAADPVVAAAPPAAPAATDPPAADSKTADDTAVVYDFKVPEGFEIGPEGEDLKAVAKELKMPAEGVQKIVDLAVRREQARIDAHAAQVKAWQGEITADKDLGGDKLNETKALAAKAYALAPPEVRESLKQMLDASGLGDFPPLIRWAVAVGKALSEDKHVLADTPAPAAESIANRLYGNTQRN